MVQPTSHAPAAGSGALPDSPLSGGPKRPQGVGLTALALGALLAFYLVQSLLQLTRESPAARPAFEPLLLCGARAVELLLVWQYWKGRDVARLFVLLWSLLAAARAVAYLADHNLDPAALMSHPVDFLQALLALFLLFWLNTPRLRAWFKKISATAADLIAPCLVGRLCTALDFDSSAANSHPACRLAFEHGAGLTLTCPFRIVLDDNLAFVSSPGSGNHLQPAPVPNPSTDPDDARRLLQNLRVTAVRLAPHTSDLFLTFEMGIQLQTWGHALAARSAALPDPAFSPTTLWSFSGPGLNVTASADGLTSQLAAASAEANDELS
ncbi:MAG: hypothetical protein WA532_13880 [Candidatus Korobacteraceae bacterium]